MINLLFIRFLRVLSVKYICKKLKLNIPKPQADTSIFINLPNQQPQTQIYLIYLISGAVKHIRFSKMFWDLIKMNNEHWIQLKHHIIAHKQNETKQPNTRHPASSPMMHLYWHTVLEYKGSASVVKLNIG